MISKTYYFLSDRGKLFQIFTVLTAEVRPPSEMFLICFVLFFYGGGTINLNYSSSWFLSEHRSFEHVNVGGEIALQLKTQYRPLSIARCDILAATFVVLKILKLLFAARIKLVNTSRLASVKTKTTTEAREAY